MEEQEYELIERYLLGELSEPELAQVEKALVEDKLFAQKVEKYRKLIESLNTRIEFDSFKRSLAYDNSLTDKGNSIRLIIGVNDEVISDEIEDLFSNEPSIQIVGKAFSIKKLLELVQVQKSIDVILLDMDLHEMKNFEIIAKLREINSEIKILLFWEREQLTRRRLSEATASGANGYIQKIGVNLKDAIFKVYNREFVLTIPQTSQGRPEGVIRGIDRLSNREKQITCLIVKNHVTREIAEELHIATSTVERHRQNIMSKLGVKNTVGLVRYAVEHGICA